MLDVTEPRDQIALKMALLALDSLAARAIEALSARGVDAILLKGPTTATWLYDDPLAHVYTDVDLLVPPDGEQVARRVLADDLGMQDHHAGVLGIYRPQHEVAFVSEAGTVDLHVGLIEQPAAAAREAWSVLWARSHPFDLRGARVPALDPVARALHVAMHAGGRPSPKAIRDLEQLVERLDAELWPEVASLAGALGMEREVAEGLRKTPSGAALAEAQGLTRLRTVAGVLGERKSHSEAAAVERVLNLPRGSRVAAVRTWLRADRAPANAALLRRRLRVAMRLPRAVVHTVRARRVVRASARAQGDT